MEPNRPEALTETRLRQRHNVPSERCRRVRARVQRALDWHSCGTVDCAKQNGSS
jgi:hypothetical protein